MSGFGFDRGTNEAIRVETVDPHEGAIATTTAERTADGATIVGRAGEVIGIENAAGHIVGDDQGGGGRRASDDGWTNDAAMASENRHVALIRMDLFSDTPLRR